MPWWLWVLLWTVLVLASVVVLAVLGWGVLRRFFRTLDSVEDLGEDMARRWEDSSSLVAQRIRQAPVPGILIPVRQARDEFVAGRSTRHERKVAQRIARRDRLGQPQRLGDLRYGAQKGNTHG